MLMGVIGSSLLNVLVTACGIREASTSLLLHTVCSTILGSA
jgi:uncharacterized membrane protein YeaQ/YmgE (transglycosylase-associated protein family)